MLIPFVIVGVVIGISASSAGAGMSALTITLLVVGGVIVGLLLLSITSLISVPVVVFFQSYALHFFGSRYEPLQAVLYPTPPPQAPPLGPVAPMPQPAM